MQNTVVAIGKFDGVHIAHRELLQTAVNIAKKNNYKSVALIISSDQAPVIVDSDEREAQMLSLGLDEIQLRALDREFMSMSAEDFVNKILKDKLSCAHVVVGYNFRFGKDRYADAALLSSICAEKGMGCTVIDKISCQLGGETVDASSTNIRSYLSLGDVESASLILGRKYRLSGEVMHGRKIGRTIGIPTANIALDEKLILPKTGVYATLCRVDGAQYPSITNIGSNPTVSSDTNVKIETNIIGFCGDIYGKKIEISFAKRIRDEKKFADLKELKEQINSDIKFAVEALKALM